MTKLVYGKSAVYVEDAKAAVEAVRPELVKIMKGWGLNIMNKVTLKGNLFSARRESDQYGADGYVTATDDLYIDAGEANAIVVGKRLRIGSISGRYLLLSEVKEILEVNEEKTVCKIRTRNSVYTIKAI